MKPQILGAMVVAIVFGGMFLTKAELPEVSPATWDGALLGIEDIEAFMEEIAMALGINTRRQALREREAEGKSFIGAINRAQQGYRLENLEFAATLQELGVGLPSETENYSYAIESQPDPARSVMATARTKQKGLWSYTGVVFVLENGSMHVILCETDAPSMTPPEIPVPPRDSNVQPLCPAGSSAL